MITDVLLFYTEYKLELYLQLLFFILSVKSLGVCRGIKGRRKLSQLFLIELPV